MIHEELVQTMKWKQIRGKFYPQLSYLVKVNTPRMVIQETKKAFKKLPNLEQAITALGNLKGVGTTMASGKQKLIYHFFVCSLLSVTSLCLKVDRQNWPEFHYLYITVFKI